MRVKEVSEKAGLKPNIKTTTTTKTTKIMVSGLITSQQIEGENVEVVKDFLFLGSKTTTDGDCSNIIRRRLLLVRNPLTNMCVEKRRHYSAAKVPYSQGYGFPSGHAGL